MQSFTKYAMLEKVARSLMMSHTLSHRGEGGWAGYDTVTF